MMYWRRKPKERKRTQTTAEVEAFIMVPTKRIQAMTPPPEWYEPKIGPSINEEDVAFFVKHFDAEMEIILDAQ